MAHRTIPAEHAAFGPLPVRLTTVGARGEELAFHVAGCLGNGQQLPLICLAGYTRNMTDFAEFVTLFQASMGADWPLLLVDLRGRGRSSDRTNRDAYSTTSDASGQISYYVGSTKAGVQTVTITAGKASTSPPGITYQPAAPYHVAISPAR